MELSELLPWREHSYGPVLVGLLALFGGALLIYLVVHRGLMVAIRRIAASSATRWDDALVEAGAFSRVAYLAPAFVVYSAITLIPDLHPTATLVIQRVAASVILVVITLSAGALLSAINEVYAANPENRQRPIKGYLQIVRIALYLSAGLLVLASLLDRSPLIFLSGLGAMAAVLLLVFRDTILGLVASIQLTGNDMVHVGDWIEMPQYGADGDVIDVALHTVKVQNWDKTITTIPTHKLIEDAFKNWRGMAQTGARRIKRSLLLDLTTVRFLEDEELERFGRFALLRDYIKAKREEVEAFNRQPGRDRRLNADIRRLTNVGTLRAYIVNYLRAHPKIHQGQTLIVRQLALTPHGLPLEIYAFTNDTDWTRYEGVQSDIFDHILSVLPEFGLRTFQHPSGADISRLGSAP